MVLENPTSELAEEIASVPITAQDSGGHDHSEHPIIPYNAITPPLSAFTNITSTVSSSDILHAIYSDYEWEKHFYPKAIGVSYTITDSPYVMSRMYDGNSYYLSHWDGSEGDNFGNYRVLWINNSNSTARVRGFIRKSNFIYPLLVQKTPTVDWKISTWQVLGKDRHLFLEGWKWYYNSPPDPKRFSSIFYSFFWASCEGTIDSIKVIYSGAAIDFFDTIEASQGIEA